MKRLMVDFYWEKKQFEKDCINQLFAEQESYGNRITKGVFEWVGGTPCLRFQSVKGKDKWDTFLSTVEMSLRWEGWLARAELQRTGQSHEKANV